MEQPASGHSRERRLGEMFVSSPEYRTLYSAYEEFREMDPPLTLVDGGETPIETRDALLARIVAEGRRGLTIQRYKGLGEMNPDQLWKTTMDPEVRTLLRVTVEDEVEADHVFTVLLGNDVPPRRKFIEENAKYVKNLHTQGSN
ncbi:MAG: hypothetical protein KAQ78_10025 [Candidatus Latescibacteria bacterium]|nr:hypothetical protein [Candidatus Latescibacterota bacterium]